ncbi:MAG TPA: hypothetical protein VJL58_05405, partial [Pyrinomonadaceae bacterium]|nr:hypothetical protein [Pyrinomonadaceae bacterium]
SPIQTSQIIQIEYMEKEMRTTYKRVALLTNINPTNYFDSQLTVTLIADGRAKSYSHRYELRNGVRQPSSTENKGGTFEPALFEGMARVFVENDFLNEPDSPHSSSLGIRKSLLVAYDDQDHTRRVKVIETGNMDKNTQEAQAMLDAFHDLKSKVTWNAVAKAN